MENQNIFDNKVFFDSYMNLRDGANFNDLLEQPAMRALLPDLRGMDILDIGCGFGANCLEFSYKANSVTGIDISQRMLETAEKINCGGNIKYMKLSMEDLSCLPSGSYDLVYSSLAFHYAIDFDRLIASCFRILKKGGTLLFSQENPITTASKNTDNRYVKDEEGNVFFKIADYQSEGERHVKWFVDDVIHQHRKVSTIITTLCKNGFIIQECAEPKPAKEAVKILKGLARDLIKPSFIIFKAKKGE